jgi:phosphate transport system substrate-binding protein
MKNLIKTVRTLALLLACAALYACGERIEEDNSAGTADALRIEGAGATFPAPLYERWFGVIRENQPGVHIAYQAVGSGEGVRRFLAGEVDFAASDAVLRESQHSDVARGVNQIPATAGMVVLAYNVPGIGPGLQLPRDVYLDIFSGEIWRWDDPRIAAANPGLELPSKLIQVVARRDGSGTTFAFTSHLAAVNERWREAYGVGKLIDWPGGAMTSNGNAGVAQRIKITLGSIGYVEYGFARRLGLPMAELQNQAGNFIAPSAESGRLALEPTADQSLDTLHLSARDPSATGAYPIVSYSWLLLYERYDDAQTAQALQSTLSWALAEGQDVAAEMGYIPLPDSVADRARDAVARLQ